MLPTKVLNVVKNHGLYEHDISTIKRMGHIIKVANLNAIRINGLEDNHIINVKGAINDSKLDNNIARAKSRVKEYVLCNKWDYFCTFTISPEKYDRHNFNLYYTDFSRFLRNYNRYCTEEEKVKYIFIPETHKDGAWHIHGFIKGIKDKDIYNNRFGYLSWKQYEERFGFISFDRIKDIEASSNYILKYITKDVSKCVSDLNCHIFYSTKGLKKAELIFRGKIQLNCSWDYETPDGYCRLKYFDERKENYLNFIEVLE